MSRFFSDKYSALDPYVPGEQPREMRYVKLNTNESPYPPPPEVTEAVAAACAQLNLYPDPECTVLREMLAGLYGVAPENVLPVNGSDEALNFIFMAFGDASHPFVFPDITYGFYPVFCRLNAVPFEEMPLQEDFTVCVEDYTGAGKNIVLANPNAPTGLALPVEEIERIAASNPDNVVVIDEAYVDFGGESCIPLTKKYDNLLVVQTFSKSRSMAGLRLGYAVGSAALIADLHTVKDSTNPYNVSRPAQAAGEAALGINDHFMANCRAVAETREYTAGKLKAMGFSVLPSLTNFLFARHPDVAGEALYRELKAQGVLVRHFDKPRIRAYNRITIGTREQMDVFLAATEKIIRK